VFIAAGIFQLGFGVLSQVLSMRTANEVTSELGRRLYSHLLHLPFSYFRRWSVGETIARISETDRIRTFLVSATTGTLLDIIFLVIYLAVLFSISVSLSMVVLVALPLQLLVYFFFGPAIRSRMKSQFDSSATLQNRMVETLSGINTVKALNIEKEMGERLTSSLKLNLSASYKVGILSVVSNKLTFIIQRSMTTLIIFIGAQAVFSGEITLGQLIAFHLIVDKVTSPIANFSKLWESWQNIKVSRLRLGDILNTRVEFLSRDTVIDSEISQVLSFSEVTFHYPNTDPILDKFSIVVQPNTLTLVKGDTGSGKSTFARLAAGIEQPQKGTIFLGSKDISNMDIESLRRCISYVPQESYLFAGSIRDNITIGRQGISDEDIISALTVCSAKTLLESLPYGLETNVGDRGAALSGGQRQKIAIARCLVRAPKILILDEPTSSLDQSSIDEMAMRLSELKSEMTIIVVTHQPGQFVSVDQTVVFGILQ
jgi:subfamily B ATP-binding cassette protein HlyB/CyaB